MKHRFDSFTIGSRARIFKNGFRVTGITVYYRETAKVNNPASVSGGSVSNATTLELQEVQNDWVYTVDAERPFFEEKVTLGGTLGYNRFSQKASVDRSNPFEPVFVNSQEPPLQVDGSMARGRIGTNNLGVLGLKVNYEYRNVGIEFKPRYRQNPIGFDDTQSDQRGHNLRIVQEWRGLKVSAEYDRISRNSNSRSFRDKFDWAIGYYGKLDISLNQNVSLESVNSVSNRTGVSNAKDEKQIVSEIYARLQLTPKLSLFLKPQRKDIFHTNTGARFLHESLYGKLELFASTNLRLVGEFRTTHFSDRTQEAVGAPYEDNFIRTKIEFNF